MYSIASLHDFRRHLGLTETDADADADLRQALEKASHLIESLTQRRYCPALETRRLTIDGSNPRELILPDDLLDLISIESSQGILSKDTVRRLPIRADLPASVLILNEGELFSGELSVSGVWGWHDCWTQAWRKSGDQIRGSTLNASAAWITVDDVDGKDQDGISPRFQVGQLLRVESEYIRLIAIDREGNRLQALRGVNGTEAVSHAAGAPVEIYRAASAIRDLCLRYAELLINTAGLLEDETSPALRRLRRLTA
ncbi:MAG: hypothetical protein OXN94_16690 [Chloroflexota bacterium]|nr:hypothetical protein [Chloroflexota bacterium]